MLNFEVSWSAVSILVSGVINTVDHKKIDCIVEYLREYEAICKKALTRGSRAQVELFDEKTVGRKSRDSVPLKLLLGK
jgi:hypothetical protein